MSEKELCARDLSILNLIFDKNECEIKVNECNQPIVDEIEVRDIVEDETPENVQSKIYELEGVTFAEAGNLDEALLKFNAAIQQAPGRPSSYNNRAQLYRYLDKDDLAIIDLEKSMAHCGDTHQLTKCRALCQRGIIKRKQNDIDGARDDFNECAKLGSKFARQQLVELNPYAQLCNQMVTKILSDYTHF